MTQQPQNQKLCLKWNNHTSNLLTVLGGFQQRDILVDVTISCQGKNIKAHKMVLSACSSYFQSIFLENPCQHPIVIINGMKYDDVLSILNFMYKGEVNVSQDGLASFLQAAESLKVKGLADMCGSNKTPNSNSQNNQQIEQNNHPSRTDTPPRRKHRNRKRSLSDSNRSEDEGPGASRPRVREPSSPEIHELSGDESFTGDNNSNGPPFNSVPRVPQNTYSHPHQQSSNLDDEEDEFDVEPTNLLEQTLTTDNVPMNEQPNSENKLRIERIVGNVGSEEMESSSLQEQPGSPPDIKPIINYGDSSAGPSSEGSMMLYNDQSQPGPSSVQDGSMLHDNSHAAVIIYETPARKQNYDKPNHACETSQLLQEISDDHMCQCILDDSRDFIEEQNETAFNDFLQERNVKNQSKNKELFLYEADGILKAIELTAKNTSAVESQHLIKSPQPTEKKTLIINQDNNHNSSITTLEKHPTVQLAKDNILYPKKNIMDLKNWPIITQTHSHYMVKKVSKKRGRKPKKKQPFQQATQKSKDENKDVFGFKIKKLKKRGRPAIPKMPKEVPLTESNKSERKSQRERKGKTASEMLMIKRRRRKKIMENKNTKIDKDLNLLCEFNSGKLKTESNNNETSIKTSIKEAIEFEKYGPEVCPPGWSTIVKQRQFGKSAGQVDVYFVTPEGKRLRSKTEVADYLLQNSLPYLPEEFCFRKHAYLRQVHNNSNILISPMKG